MKYRVLAFAASMLPLVACQYSPDTATRTISYNQSISQSTNDLFLLNIMRARTRSPTYYTRNQGNNTTSTFNPSISSTISPAVGSTVESQFTKNFGPTSQAAGFYRTFEATKTAAASTLSLVPGLGATETNQLTLTNLDDQPSMNGLLTPVTVTQLSNYVRQGYNGEEMALLTIGRINVSMALLQALPDVVSEVCAVKLQNYGGEIDSEYMQNEPYCAYLFAGMTPAQFPYVTRDQYIDYPTPTTGVYFSKYIGAKDEIEIPGRVDAICFAGGLISAADPQNKIDAFEMAKAAQKAAEEKQKKEAKKSGKKAEKPAEAPDEVVSLFNDPAVDPRVDGRPASLNSQSCFDEVVTVLMALNMHPIDGPPTALYRAPIKMVENNDRYLADLTQQKLKVAFLYDGSTTDRIEEDDTGPRPSSPKDPFKSPSQIGVCKGADDMAIAFEGDGYSRARFELGESASRTKGVVTKGLHIRGVPTNAGNPEKRFGAQKTTLHSISFLQLQIPTAIQLTKSEDDADDSGDACQQAIKDWEGADDSDSLTLVYSPRSLEGIVYYLGQILRRRYDSPGDLTPITFVNWGYANGASYIYRERLFDAEPGRKPGHSIAEAADESGAFYVPGLCDSATDVRRESDQNIAFGCSFEFPNHASAQVFTMLNQLWGLNKTQATTPAIPTVDVISH